MSYLLWTFRGFYVFTFTLVLTLYVIPGIFAHVFKFDYAWLACDLWYIRNWYRNASYYVLAALALKKDNPDFFLHGHNNEHSKLSHNHHHKQSPTVVTQLCVVWILQRKQSTINKHKWLSAAGGKLHARLLRGNKMAGRDNVKTSNYRSAHSAICGWELS